MMLELLIEALPILMLGCLVLLLFSGLPVSIVLAGLGVAFSLIGIVLGEMPAIALYNIPLKIYGSVSFSLFYAAVVMLLFMGVALEKSGIANDLLRCLQLIFQHIPGGLALAVILIGVILAPAAGLVGASVVTLTIIAMPTMLARGYPPEIAAGSIAAAGTVGIILPPAVMLFFLAGKFEVTIGGMFLTTVLPGSILIGLYLVFYLLKGWRSPPDASSSFEDAPETLWQWSVLLIRGLVLPVALVSLVLGSIIFGWATPGQSAALGAAGGLLLILVNRRLTLSLFREVMTSTALLSAMVFFIIIAATVFSYPFIYFGGGDLISDSLGGMSLGPWGTLVVILTIIFLLGFFIDWIEITVIMLPLFMPILKVLDFSAHGVPDKMGMMWMAALVALTLQTSFLTPPFGFALFFMKGSAPPEVSLRQIYRGIVPVLLIQLFVIALVMALPQLTTWLPIRAYGN